MDHTDGVEIAECVAAEGVNVPHVAGR
jgi:hypothetical protein